MMEIIPALLVVICAEGRGCREEIYPMPNWEVCLEAPGSASHAQAPRELDRQEFHVSMSCIGQEKDS